jgi:hypothetical protein
VVVAATGSYLRIGVTSHRISEISRNRQPAWSVVPVDVVGVSLRSHAVVRQDTLDEHLVELDNRSSWRTLARSSWDSSPLHRAHFAHLDVAAIESGEHAVKAHDIATV